MNTYTEVIDGHKCKFDINEYKGQYHGLVDSRAMYYRFPNYRENSSPYRGGCLRKVKRSCKTFYTNTFLCSSIR